MMITVRPLTIAACSPGSAVALIVEREVLVEDQDRGSVARARAMDALRCPPDSWSRAPRSPCRSRAAAC